MKILVFGYGLIGRQRVEALDRNPAVSSIVVHDPRLADGLPLTPKAISCDQDEALDQPYDAALIATPHDAVAGLLPKVVRVAPRLLVEKPVGRNAGETEQLLAIAAESGCRLFVGLNYRQLKHVHHAKQLLASGELGRVLCVDAVLSHGAQPGYENSWKTDPIRCGGGVCLDPGIHLLDLLCWLFGGAEVAGGLLSRLYWPIAVEDHASVILTLPGGAVGNLSLSLSSWRSRFEMIVETEKAQLMIQGRGKFYGEQRLTVVEKWPWLCPEKPRETEYNYGVEDSSLRDETGEFIAVAGGAKLDTELATGADALRAMQLVDACYLELPLNAVPKSGAQSRRKQE